MKYAVEERRRIDLTLTMFASYIEQNSYIDTMTLVVCESHVKQPQLRSCPSHKEVVVLGVR